MFALSSSFLMIKIMLLETQVIVLLYVFIIIDIYGYYFSEMKCMTHIYNFVMKCTKQQSFNCDTYLANLSFRIKFCRIFFYLHFVEKWNRGCVDYLLTHVQLVKWCFISLLLYKAFDWPVSRPLPLKTKYKIQAPPPVCLKYVQDYAVFAIIFCIFQK